MKPVIILFCLVFHVFAKDISCESVSYKINVEAFDLSLPGEGKIQIKPFPKPTRIDYHYTKTNPKKLVLTNPEKSITLTIGNESGPVIIDGDDPGEDHLGLLKFQDGLAIKLKCRIHTDF